MRLRGSKLSRRFQHRKQTKTRNFYVEIQIEKIMGRRERIHYFQETRMNLLELYSEPVPSLAGGECLFVLNCWPGGGWSAIEFDITTTIFMYEFILTAEIVGALLLWSPAKNPTQSITAQARGHFHITNVGEVRLYNWKRRSKRSVTIAILLEAEVSEKE